MTQRKELNPLQEGGDVMRPIHPRDQGRFSAMDVPQSRRSMPNREVCSTVKPFLRWHSGSPLCCGLLRLDRVSRREHVSPGSPALERKHTRQAPATPSTSNFCDQEEKQSTEKELDSNLSS